MHTYLNGRGGIKEILAIALPMVVSMAADILMAFTDRIFLAKISTDHMNAAMGGSLGAQLLMFFFIGLTGFSTALVAQLYGAGRRTECPSIFYQSAIIIAGSIPILFILKPFVLMFFNASIDSPVQLELQSRYFSLLVWGSLFFMMRHALACYFSGIGRTRIVMASNLVALLCNVAVNYALIYGKLGFPAMGIDGAAIGSIISMALACIIMLIAFFAAGNSEFKPLEAVFFSAVYMKKLLRYGYPAGLELLFNFAAFTALMHIFYGQSPEVATAASIVFNWDAVSFVPLVGLEIAVTSLFGRYLAQRKLAFAHRTTVSAIICGTVFTFIVFVFFVSIPEKLCMVFSPSGESEVFARALPLAASMLRVASIYVLSEAFMLVFIGALRGAGDTLWTMAASVSIHWLFVGAAYFMLNIAGAGPLSTWYVIVGVILLFALVFYLRYKQGKWKTGVIINLH
jgi:multidrug resistance protein, MATE family